MVFAFCSLSVFAQPPAATIIISSQETYWWGGLGFMATDSVSLYNNSGLAVLGVSTNGNNGVNITNIPIAAIIPGIMPQNSANNGILTSTIGQIQKSLASIDQGGNITGIGNITATNFTGNGSGLTNLNAAQLTGNVPTNTLGVKLAQLSTGDASGLTALPAGQLTGTVPPSNLPATVSTNINTKTFIAFTSFSPSPATPINGVYQFQGDSVTNTFITTSTNGADALYMDPSGFATRDPAHLKWTDNKGNVTYLLSYNTTHTNIGVATSTDDRHWTFTGYILFSTNYGAQFSPKFFINATNGLMLSLALGLSQFIGTNAPMVCKISETNFTNYSGLFLIPTKGLFDIGEQSSGTHLYYNGLYYYFDTGGDEFTNNAEAPTGWGLLNDGQDNNWANSGPSVVNFKGMWYWFVTDGVQLVIKSPDLINWTDLLGVSVFSAPFSSGSPVNTSMNNEGTAIVENYATPPPYFSGVVTNGQSGVTLGLTRPCNGSGLTNLVLSNITGIGDLAGKNAASASVTGATNVWGSLNPTNLPYAAQGATAALTNLSNGNGAALTNQGFARTLTSTNMLWTPTVQADGNTNWSGVLTNVPAAQITGTLPALNANSLTNGFQNTPTRTNFLFGSSFTNTTQRSEQVVVNARCNPTTTLSALFGLVTSPTGATYTTNSVAGMEADVIFTTAPHPWAQLTAIVPPGGIWKVVDISGDGVVTITNSYYQTLQ